MKSIRRFVKAVTARKSVQKEPVTSIDDPDLRVVVTAFDETEAASAVLERAEGWRPGRPAVLRHHLVLPEPQLEAARGLLAPGRVGAAPRRLWL